MTNQQAPKLAATNSDAGQVSELFVAADLLARGLPVTKPLNINGAHDLHAKIGDSWLTFQVKSGTRNKRTGTIHPTLNRTKIKSDILSVVHFPSRTIRYMSGVSGVPAVLVEVGHVPAV